MGKAILRSRKCQLIRCHPVFLGRRTGIECRAWTKSFTTSSFRPNHYSTLGVSEKATPAQIKSAYYELCKELHPDKNPSPQAAERFKLVSSAYDVLSSPEKRRQYDAGFSRDNSFGPEPTWGQQQEPPKRNMDEQFERWQRDFEMRHPEENLRRNRAYWKTKEEWYEHHYKKAHDNSHFNDWYQERIWERMREQRKARARGQRPRPRPTVFHLIIWSMFFWISYSLLDDLFERSRPPKYYRDLEKEIAAIQQPSVTQEEFIKRYYDQKEKPNSEDSETK